METIIKKNAMYEVCLLHAKADRAMRVVIANELERFHVTMMEWLLLGAICNGPAEGLTMTRLAQSLDVTMPQVTALMNALTTQKLAKQKIKSSDRRSRHVTPTRKGRALLDKLEQSIAVAMRDWLKDIPADQFRTYMDTVRQLAKN